MAKAGDCNSPIPGSNPGGAFFYLMLTIIPTPIGNLEDITLRALRTLKEVDLILAEDTRHTKKLLIHYQISTQLSSYHKFNEKKELNKILSLLKNNHHIALVSDAGTPVLSDPGCLLVKEAIKKEIKITSLPGASAITTSISLVPSDNPNFQFLGFFSKKKNERKQQIDAAINYPGLTLFFVTKYNILKVLKEIPDSCFLSIFRELTKIHEEKLHSTAKELRENFSEREPRGEMTLVIHGERSEEINYLSPSEIFSLLLEYLPKSSAAKVTSKITNSNKKNFYLTSAS